jgi:hypothetical protein
MGLVVSIFAYLCSVIVLVLTLAMSFGVLLYPPEQITSAQQTTAMAAKPRASKPASVSSTSNDRSGLRVQEAAKEVGADISNSTVRAPNGRRLVRQARAKDWLHQQEQKVFGYAEEPSASFLYDRFQ